MNKRSFTQSNAVPAKKMDSTSSPRKGTTPSTVMSQSQKTLIGILVIVALASLGATYYFYSQLNQLKVNPQAAAQEEAKALVAKVGKLIVLPEGEDPTIATVADPEALREQPFFAKAKQGDKVLIYTNARKAILYDVESNKIVEVAPINIGPGAQTAPPPSTPSTP